MESRSQKNVQVFQDFRERVFAVPRGGEELVRVYDEWAKNFKETSLDAGVCGQAYFAAVISDFINNKSSRILDAASGVGMVGEELKGRGFTCINALDPSQESLDKSRELHVYTEYICDTLDEHRTEIPDDRYDAVVMCGAFGVPGHVTDACFPELIRITKPGGYIMFTVSDKVLEQWNDKLEAVIHTLSQQGLWEIVDYRWILYYVSVSDSVTEKAKVPVLRVLKTGVC